MASTNGRDRFVALSPGKGAAYPGWQEPLPDLVARLRSHVDGLRGRLNVPDTQTSIWPSAVAGRYIYHPDDKVLDVDVTQKDKDFQPVNMVVPSGRTVDIRLIFPGPGVFVGRWLKCSVYMRLHCPTLKGDNEMWLPVVSNTGAGVNASTPFTTRFSVFPLQPQTPYIAVPGPGDVIRPPALNWCWNLKDTRSGRLYADRLISNMMMLPSTWMGEAGAVTGGSQPRDGDLFDLRTPWVFERDGQLSFQFRPITDLYQFASSIPGDGPVMGLPFDDREGGKRDQSVLVQVEMHGFRFETMQDALHAGALTQVWGDDSNGAPVPLSAIRMAKKGG